MLLSFLSFANRSGVVQHERRKKAFWIFKCVLTLIYYFRFERRGRKNPLLFTNIQRFFRKHFLRKNRQLRHSTHAYAGLKCFTHAHAMAKRSIHVHAVLKHSMHARAVLRHSMHVHATQKPANTLIWYLLATPEAFGSLWVCFICSIRASPPKNILWHRGHDVAFGPPIRAACCCNRPIHCWQKYALIKFYQTKWLFGISCNMLDGYNARIS